MYFQHATRALHRRPKSTIFAVLSLGLGLGTTIAAFTAVNAVILRQLPFPKSDRIVRVYHHDSSVGSASRLSPDEVQQVGLLDVFEDITTVYSGSDVQFDLRLASRAERVRGALVDPGFFELLAVEPFVGKLFDSRSENEAVVVLSFELWERLGGGTLVGEQLALNGRFHTVIGVLPRNASVPLDSELWVPVRSFGSDVLRLGLELTPYVDVIALRAAGRSTQEVEAALALVQARGAGQTQVIGSMRQIRSVPLREWLVGGTDRLVLLIFLVSGLLFVVALSNVTGIQFAQAISKQHELRTRMALGASSTDLAGQLLTEAAGIVILGVAFGLALAQAFLGSLVPLMPVSTLLAAGLQFDWPLVAFLIALAVLATAGLGLIHTIHVLTGSGRVITLNESSRNASMGRPGVRAFGFCVAIQATIAVALMGACFAAAENVGQFRNIDLGFDPDSVTTFKVTLPSNRYPSASNKAAFRQSALDALERLPGIISVGAVTLSPIHGARFQVPLGGVMGELDTADAETRLINLVSVTPGYFEALRSRIEFGRSFTDGDRFDGLQVAIVNQSLAERRWASTSESVGSSIAVDGRAGKLQWRHIVGVVRDTRALTDLDSRMPTAYIPIQQSEVVWPFLTFIVRSRQSASSAVEMIRQTISGLDAELSITSLEPLSDHVERVGERPIFFMMLLAGLGCVAASLAAAGSYSMVSYAVEQRQLEFAIRTALGARYGHIVRTILGGISPYLISGVLFGSVAFVVILSQYGDVLYQYVVPNYLPGVAAMLVVAVVSTVGAYLPSRKLVGVSPGRAINRG